MKACKLRKSDLKQIAARAEPGERLYEVTVTMRFLSKETDLDKVADSVTSVTDTIHTEKRCRGRIEASRVLMPGETPSSVYEDLVKRLGPIGMEPR